MLERLSSVLVLPLYPAPVSGLKAGAVFKGEEEGIPASAGNLVIALKLLPTVFSCRVLWFLCVRISVLSSFHPREKLSFFDLLDDLEETEHALLI